MHAETYGAGAIARPRPREEEDIDIDMDIDGCIAMQRLLDINYHQEDMDKKPNISITRHNVSICRRQWLDDLLFC